MSPFRSMIFAKRYEERRSLSSQTSRGQGFWSLSLKKPERQSNFSRLLMPNQALEPTASREENYKGEIRK